MEDYMIEDVNPLEGAPLSQQLQHQTLEAEEAESLVNAAPLNEQLVKVNKALGSVLPQEKSDEVLAEVGAITDLLGIKVESAAFNRMKTDREATLLRNQVGAAWKLESQKDLLAGVLASDVPKDEVTAGWIIQQGAKTDQQSFMDALVTASDIAATEENEGEPVSTFFKSLRKDKQDTIAYLAHQRERIKEISPGFFGTIQDIVWGALPVLGSGETLDARQVRDAFVVKPNWKSEAFRDAIKEAGIEASTFGYTDLRSDLVKISEVFHRLPVEEQYRALEDIIEAADRFNTDMGKVAFIESLLSYTKGTGQLVGGAVFDTIGLVPVVGKIPKAAVTIKSLVRGAGVTPEAIEALYKTATKSTDRVSSAVANLVPTEEGAEILLKKTDEFSSVSDPLTAFVIKTDDDGFKTAVRRIKATSADPLEEGITLKVKDPAGNEQAIKFSTDPDSGIQRAELLYEAGKLDEIITASQDYAISTMVDGVAEVIKPIGAIRGFIGFEKFKFLSARSIYDAVSRHTGISHRFFRDLEEGYKEAFSTIPQIKRGRAQEKIFKIFDHMEDLEDSLPAPSVLRNGFTTKHGEIVLDNSEIAALYKSRKMFDDMYTLANATEATRLSKAGFGSIATDKGLAIAKWVVGDLKGITFSGIIKEGKYQELPTKLKGKALKEFLADNPGVKVAEVQNIRGIKMGKDSLVLVENSPLINRLPANVIPYRKNYIPRVYDVTRTRYWATAIIENGKGVSKLPSMAFDSRAAADAWAAGMNKKLTTGFEKKVASGEEALLHKYIVSDAGETGGPTSGQVLVETLFGAGHTPTGVGFGRRAKTVGYQGNFKELPPEADTFTAISSAFRKLSAEVSASELRPALQKRFLEVIKNTEEKRGMKILEDTNNFLSPFTKGVDPGIQRTAEQLRDYISIHMGIMPDGDNAVKAAIKGISRWMEDATFKGVKILDFNVLGSDTLNPRRLMYWAGIADPVRLMKAANYELLIGMFNPSQFFIQASGMAQALSLHPTYALKSFQHMTLLRGIEAMEMFGRRTEKGVEVLAKKLLRMDEKEATAFYNLWKDTGLTTSQVFEREIFSKGLTRAGISEVMRLGRIPVNEGEKVARMTSFSVVVQEYMKANKISKFSDISAHDLGKIQSRFTDVYFDLSHANKSLAMKGVAGIPLQFSSMFFNTVETLMGKTLSSMDKLKLMAGQIVLFGTAGGVAGGDYIDMLIQQMFDVEPDKEKQSAGERTYTAIKEGLLESLFQAIGMPIEISGRASLVGNPFLGDMVDGVKPSMLLGASYTVMNRTNAALTGLVTLMEGVLDPEYKTTPEDAQAALRAILNMTSANNYIQKALVMARYGEIRTSGGQLVVYDRELGTEIPFANIIAQALGFEPKVISEMRDMKSLLKKHDEAQKEVASVVVTAVLNSRPSRSENMSGKEVVREFERITALAQMLIDASPYKDDHIARQKIWDLVKGGLDSKMTSQFRKLMQQWVKTSNKPLPSAIVSNQEGN